VGAHQDALWPRRHDEDPDRIAPMAARGLRRRRLTGIHSFGVELRHGRWVAKIKLRPDADEPAIRAAADRILIEAKEVEAIRTIRAQRSVIETEPAHRALALVGVLILLAALRGLVRHARVGDACDFLVADTPVRLLPEHQLGPLGSPVVLDTSGTPSPTKATPSRRRWLSPPDPFKARHRVQTPESYASTPPTRYSRRSPAAT
jgi:hypothetical protein